MTWIKIVLIASFMGILVVLFRNRHGVALRAWSRLAAITLFAAAVVSIADPNIPQWAAERLGVSRGTDLILYLLVVVFAITTLGLFFRIRENENRVRQLARALAISEAIRREETKTDGLAARENATRDTEPVTPRDRAAS
ncbi:DUF2304 domain-containing protein [Pedococcus sp. 5OH_020]|uniref:DUF2304 domain-containing protein n=1 Tax=Pedococcus sp. 5OH_020 TaxID=2989814 RepID=UPI0022E9FE11|nr:DUF2304 domain-containing protein [Pedococcus sp. 5OH_020]